LEREFAFRSGFSIKGIPLISANMDTTGTFEIAIVLAKYKCFTAIHKGYKLEEWK
jgi:GMP reductase